MIESAQAGIQAADRAAFDEDAQREFTAAVTSIREVARVDGKQVWQIALSHTLFAPGNSGGGVLIATARSGKTLAVDVIRVEQCADNEVWHTTHKPLQEGTEVRGILPNRHNRAATKV